MWQNFSLSFGFKVYLESFSPSWNWITFHKSVSKWGFLLVFFSYPPIIYIRKDQDQPFLSHPYSLEFSLLLILFSAMSSEPKTTQLHCYSFFLIIFFKGCGFLCGRGWPRTLCNLSCPWTCDQHASASRVLRLLLYVYPVAFSSLMFSLSFSNTFVIFLAEYYFNSGLWKKRAKKCMLMMLFILSSGVIGVLWMKLTSFCHNQRKRPECGQHWASVAVSALVLYPLFVSLPRCLLGVQAAVLSTIKW